MEIIVTNPNNGRKYKIKPDSNGLSYQLWQTTMLKKGDKARNGKQVKNEWQFTGKYPRSVCDGLQTAFNLMLCDPDDPETIEIDTNSVDRIDKYIKNKIKQIASSIEMKGDSDGNSGSSCEASDETED